MFWNNFGFLIKGKLIRSNSVLLSKHFRIQKIGNKFSQRKKLRCHSHSFHIQVYVSVLYIPKIDLPVPLQEICGPILGIFESLTDTWIWKLGLRPCNSKKRSTKMVFSLQCRPLLCEHLSQCCIKFFVGISSFVKRAFTPRMVGACLAFCSCFPSGHTLSTAVPLLPRKS